MGFNSGFKGLNLYIIIITPQGRKFFLLYGKVCFSGNVDQFYYTTPNRVLSAFICGISEENFKLH